MRCPHCDTEVTEHPASRCLDRWVTESVLGGKYELSNQWEAWDEPPDKRYVMRLPDKEYPISAPFGDWSPSTRIEDAWRVVEKMLVDGYYVSIKHDGVAWDVQMAHMDRLPATGWFVGDWRIRIEAQICQAALMASDHSRQP